MGLDPLNLNTLSPLLHRLAKTNSPRLVLAFRPQDPLPEWITHVAFLDPSLNIKYKGRKNSVLKMVSKLRGKSLKRKSPLKLLKYLGTGETSHSEVEKSNSPAVEGNATVFDESENSESLETLPAAGGDIFRAEELESLKQSGIVPVAADDASVLRGPLIQMEGILVKYGQREILGAWNQDVQGRSQRGFWWTVRRGERWGVFGPNGIYLWIRLLLKRERVRLMSYRIWKNHYIVLDYIGSSSIIFSPR